MLSIGVDLCCLEYMSVAADASGAVCRSRIVNDRVECGLNDGHRVLPDGNRHHEVVASDEELANTILTDRGSAFGCLGRRWIAATQRGS